MRAHLAEGRIHMQIDVGFGDAITPAASDMNFPTLLDDMASPNVLASPRRMALLISEPDPLTGKFGVTPG